MHRRVLTRAIWLWPTSSLPQRRLALLGLRPFALLGPGWPLLAAHQARGALGPSGQLRLRLSDQRARHERVVVDCRDGGISPQAGPVDRGFAGAVVRRACRLAAGGGNGPAA